MNKIAIIGGGISGLSTAHFLKDRFDVKVFEKEDKPGGLIKCRWVNGSLFHTCGGHVFNSKRNDVLEWFWTNFNREKEFSLAERNSTIYMNETTQIPYPIENYIYRLDKNLQYKIIDSLLDIARNGIGDPKNFEEFLKGRFGDTLYEIYFKPYNEKIWNKELNQVPLSWLEGKLPMPTIPDIIYNNINHVREKQFVHSSFWYEKSNGSQYIADKLSEGLNIQYNKHIRRIEYKDGMWYIENENFDKVIFCGNLKELPFIIDGISIQDYAMEIGKLGYHGTTSVFCEIDKNPYSWIYLPNNEYKSHRIICTGNFVQANNGNSIPQDKITATIEFTGEIDKNDILHNLDKIPFRPKYIDYQYNKYTYPIQDDNTRSMIKHLKAYLASFNLHFTGRFADWEYYNMDVAIGAAMDLCKTIK